MALNDWETLPRLQVTQSGNAVASLMLKLAKDGGRAKIRYTVRGKSSERWIRPRAVFKVRSPRWPGEYVEAHCEMRNATRVFEVENIAILETRLQSAEITRKQQPIHVGRIACDVEYIDLQGDSGEVEGVQVECPRCGHVTQSFGTGTASVKRCLALLREECPNSESNFYVEG